MMWGLVLVTVSLTLPNELHKIGRVNGLSDDGQVLKKCSAVILIAISRAQDLQ